MPIATDMVSPPKDCEAEQKMIPRSQLRPLESIVGHLALLGTDANMLAQLDRNLNELLGTASEARGT